MASSPWLNCGNDRRKVGSSWKYSPRTRSNAIEALSCSRVNSRSRRIVRDRPRVHWRASCRCAGSSVARRGPPRATTGWPDRQDEAPQAELLANSGSEPGATRARTSSNRPLEQPGKITGLSQGWAGQSPPQSRARPLTSDRTPATDVDAPRSFTRWANRNSSVCFTSLAPLRRRAARGSSAHRTRPWPRRHSLQGWSAVFLKPQFRAQHERSGFPAANDHNRTTSGPHVLMSQWPSSTGAQCRS